MSTPALRPSQFPVTRTDIKGYVHSDDPDLGSAKFPLERLLEVFVMLNAAGANYRFTATDLQLKDKVTGAWVTVGVENGAITTQ